MSALGDAGRRRSRVRPGVISLVIGLVLVAATVAWTVAVADRTTLGVMFGLVASYAISASLMFGGVTRLRDADLREPLPGRQGALDADAAWAGDPGRRSLRCRLRGHREAFVPRTADHPPMWQCRHCGASSRTHLAGGRGWVCQIPLVDHSYVYVGGTVDQPEHWRCRRCGRRRYTPPTSAGETLDASRRTADLIVRRDYDR